MAVSGLQLHHSLEFEHFLKVYSYSYSKSKILTSVFLTFVYLILQQFKCIWLSYVYVCETVGLHCVGSLKDQCVEFSVLLPRKSNFPCIISEKNFTEMSDPMPDLLNFKDMGHNKRLNLKNLRIPAMSNSRLHATVLKLHQKIAQILLKLLSI